MSIQTSGLEEFQANLQKLPELLGKKTGEVLRDEAGLLAKEIAQKTPPKTIGEGKRRVKSDIGRVFISPSKIFAAMKKVDEPAAKLFWKFITKRQLVAAMDVLRRIPFPFQHANIALTPEPAIHQRARDRRGRVSQRRKPMDIIADGKALRAYVERKQSHVGLTKSPWGKAANAFGKRLPGWMVNHKSSSVLIDQSRKWENPFVTIGSDVPWAGEFEEAIERAAEARNAKIGPKVEKMTELQLKKVFPWQS